VQRVYVSLPLIVRYSARPYFHCRCRVIHFFLTDLTPISPISSFFPLKRLTFRFLLGGDGLSFYALARQRPVVPCVPLSDLCIFCLTVFLIPPSSLSCLFSSPLLSFQGCNPSLSMVRLHFFLPASPLSSCYLPPTYPWHFFIFFPSILGVKEVFPFQKSPPLSDNVSSGLRLLFLLTPFSLSRFFFPTPELFFP